MLQRSLRSVMLHRLRSLLSTLGILFGVAAVVSMLSIGEGAKKETMDQIEQLGINTLTIRQNRLSEIEAQKRRENRSQGLTEKDAYLLTQFIPSIESHAPVKEIKASVSGLFQKMSPELMAVTREYGEIRSFKLSRGRFICASDQKNKNLVCVLGADVAKALGEKGHVGKTLRIENTPFLIVGNLELNQWKKNKNAFLATKNHNQAIFIPLGTEGVLRSFLHPENDQLSEIILKVKPHQLLSVSQMIKRILNHLHRDYEDYHIIIPQELLKQANQTQRTFNLILGSIAAISLFVGGIGIMNMMLANVRERIREIGIRRALGATKKDILVQFLSETLLITLFGAIAGTFFGICLSYGISSIAGWQTVVTAWSLLLALGMAALTGLCSGIYPAYQAAMLHPIVALRHV